VLDAAFRQIAGAVSAAVGGPYHAATLTYPGTPVFDDGGSIISPGTPVEVSCRVQVDSVTEAMRQAEGFLERDVRILILGPDMLTTEPDLSISAGPFSGQSYSLITVQRDPLAFGWECRARAV
jgi:hypothetical protein